MTEQPNLPTTQRAWIAVRKGLPSKALEFKQDAVVPTTLAKGQALIKVQAAALNPVGYKMLGLLPNFMAKRPHIVEHDLSGVVVDENETNLKKGDEVFGWIPMAETQATGQGALAEYTIVDSNKVISRPPNISAVDAAGLALAGQTAYMALSETAKVEENQRVFINGGSSSVGGYAVQIAKAKGCTVIASCSGKNVDYVKSLGADEVIDYSTSPLHAQLAEKYKDTKFHAIFDSVGLLNPNLYNHSDTYLENKGTFVSVGPYLAQPGESFFVQGVRTVWSSWLRPTFLGGTKAKHNIVMVAPKRENLEALRELVAQGKVKPLVDSTYKFDDVQSAYKRLMGGRAKGKVIVKVTDTDA